MARRGGGGAAGRGFRGGWWRWQREAHLIVVDDLGWAGPAEATGSYGGTVRRRRLQEVVVKARRETEVPETAGEASQLMRT